MGDKGTHRIRSATVENVASLNARIALRAAFEGRGNKTRARGLTPVNRRRQFGFNTIAERTG